MAFDITKKRALESAKIELVNGDDSPLLDDNGTRLGITGYGPGSKVWRQADTERARKRTARIQKAGGKITAALEGAEEDEVDFLVAITISFDDWEYPAPTEAGWHTKADMFRAAFQDHSIGFIRDYYAKKMESWEAFTKG